MGGGRQNRRELTGFEECEQLRGKALVASEAFRLAGGAPPTAKGPTNSTHPKSV